MTLPLSDDLATLAYIQAQLTEINAELKAIRAALARTNERPCPYCHESTWVELGSFGNNDYRIMCQGCGATFTKGGTT